MAQGLALAPNLVNIVVGGSKCTTFQKEKKCKRSLKNLDDALEFGYPYPMRLQ